MNSAIYILVLVILSTMTVGLKNVLFVILSAAIHELGHFIAIKLSSDKITDFRLEPGGATIIYSGMLSYKNEIIVSLSGPIMSLFAAVLVSSLGKVVNFLGRDFLVGINFLYCIFNLLPVSSLDGGRALYAALAWKFNENTAYKTEKILNISIVFLLLVAGVYAIFVYRNPTLFICSIVLLGSIN